MSGRAVGCVTVGLIGACMGSDTAPCATSVVGVTSGVGVTSVVGVTVAVFLVPPDLPLPGLTAFALPVELVLGGREWVEAVPVPVTVVVVVEPPELGRAFAGELDGAVADVWTPLLEFETAASPVLAWLRTATARPATTNKAIPSVTPSIFLARLPGSGASPTSHSDHCFIPCAHCFITRPLHCHV